MDKNRILEAVQKVAEEVKAVIQAVLQGKELGDSNLYKDLKVEAADIDLIVITVNDYIDYIESGQRKGAREGVFPPVEVIARWMSDKGIVNENDAAMRICWGLYWHGLLNEVAPRPIFDGMDGVWAEIDSHFEAWGQIIIDAITEDLDKEFNN